MNVLHVISGIDSRAGGPTAALRGLSLAQHKAGMTVRIVSTYRAHDHLDVAEGLQQAGVKVQLIGPAHSKLLLHRQLKSAIREAVAASEVVHIHALWEQIQHEAARAARRAHVPYIFRTCGMLDPWSLAQNKLVKRIYLTVRLFRDLDHAAFLHFTSATERDLAAKLNLKAQPVVVPNGIELREFAELPECGGFRARFPGIGSRRIVLFLSRVHFKKGLDLLIPAFAKSGLKDAVLVIAGPDNDNYSPTLRDLARQHGVAERTVFTGMLEGRQRLEALVDADLFVLPSRQENFGIVVVEALACGCPVLISNQVNIHQEISSAGVGGVFPLDIDALAQSLNQWMSNDAPRVPAARKARDFALSHYDWDRISARWAELYNNLALTAWAS